MIDEYGNIQMAAGGPWKMHKATSNLLYWFRQVYCPSVYCVECIVRVCLLCVPSLNSVWTCSASNSLFLKYLSYWLIFQSFSFGPCHISSTKQWIFSQPVFSPSWNEAAIGVFRGSNPPRFHMVCFPWGWNGLPWELLSWGQCWGSQQYRGQHRSTGWKTWHGILFNENNCVDCIGNQSPFSLPAGSGSYQLCQSSSVSLLPTCF